jgi:DeoR/GlpR family transcriptional regulator of sugar metabolism
MSGGKQGAQAALNARQQELLERLMQEGEVKIADLRQAFDVAEMTIRRDLEKLEGLGHLKRTFGGAIALGRDIALQDRAVTLTDEKLRIGRKAASYVRPGESLYIDGGTTTFQVARHLPAGAGLTVVTNAMNVAAELSAKGISTLVTGGTLLAATLSMVGPVTANMLSRMAFDRAFLGTTGVNALHGFSNSNIDEAEIKKLAISRSAETTIVLDHTKFGEKVLVSFAPIDEVHRIVTDRMPEGEIAAACRKAGVEIAVSDE